MNRIPGKGIKKAWLQENSGSKELKINKTSNGILLTVQAVKDGMILLEK